MKKSNFLKQRLFFGLCVAFSSMFSLSATRSSAQCATTTLDVSTGTYNYAPVAPVAPDPLWYVVAKTGAFASTLPVPGSNATVVNPHPAWAGGGNWISDNQNHVNPGIVTNKPSYLTFERRFRICGTDNITFNLQFRSDGFITDVLVDGASQGISQTVSNYAGGPLWSPAPFTISLSTGFHTLQVVVADSPGVPWNDPIGFFMNGNLFSPAAALVQDQDASCRNYDCPAGSKPGKGSSSLDKMDPLPGGTLYQNTPNPFANETAIRYNVVAPAGSAFIVVIDEMGREIQKREVQSGTGSVSIKGGTLAPGTYNYFLIVNGRRVDSKKMIVTK